MAHQVQWNSVIVSEFERLAMLTDEEILILESRVRGWTVSKQAIEYSMSESKVAKIIARLKQKYDNVQPLSEKLPPRRTSAAELYMDTH